LFKVTCGHVWPAVVSVGLMQAISKLENSRKVSTSAANESSTDARSSKRVPVAAAGSPGNSGPSGNEAMFLSQNRYQRPVSSSSRHSNGRKSEGSGRLHAPHAMRHPRSPVPNPLGQHEVYPTALSSPLQHEAHSASHSSILHAVRSETIKEEACSPGNAWLLNIRQSLHLATCVNRVYR
jgi:hypothetical protein